MHKFTPTTNQKLFLFLRRHEFLLALASNYANYLGKSSSFDGGAVVGSDLDSKGGRGAGGSYFKNKEGGFGQYYKRQLDTF